MAKLTIWTNAQFPRPTHDRFVAALAAHRLVFAANRDLSVLTAGGDDPQLAEADVAFGQPPIDRVLTAPKLKWVHLTSAGYTRFDTPAMRQTLGARGAQLTNSSSVYAEPCAQHAAAMILAASRQLPWCVEEQRTTRGWPQLAVRDASFLLRGQTVLIYGYGAIGKRLAEMLSPYDMKIIGARRTPRGDEPIEVLSFAEADKRLGQADHLVNILPGASTTDRYFSADRLARLKPTVWFYNLGRGTTVDQPTLIARLNAKQLSGAYLDVTDPEPLPPKSPLWKARNCYITPHSAGGHIGEFDRLADHFLANLRKYEQSAPLADRVF